MLIYIAKIRNSGYNVIKSEKIERTKEKFI